MNAPPVVAWIKANNRPGAFAISVITIGEIARGIHKILKHDEVAARTLSHWLRNLRLEYVDRIFDIDDQISAEWGRIDALRTRNIADGLIAATALVHEMTVVTRNVADFADTGVALVNPWAT